MKEILIIFVCFFGLKNDRYKAADNLIMGKIDTAEVLRKICVDFEYINLHLKSYRKKYNETSEISSEGGVVTGYYDKASLKKIHGIFYGEMGKTEADYYFNDKGLFFIYKKEVFYDKPMYLKDFKVKGAIETRYYINAKKIIKSISKPAGSVVLAYKDMAQEVKQLVNILNSK